jgi:Na+-driven multidrug efflux pump
MYTGTTNLVAAARESDRSTPDKPRTTNTVIGAMQLSTYVGAGLGMILFVFARPLLKAIIGNDAISPAVFAAAMKYVRIRALGMPAAAIIGSTQAACLGMQDIRSPLYVLAAAAIINFLGDVIFVGSSHPWIGGTAGAAWATVFSQYAGVAFFVRWLCHKSKKETKPPVINLSNAILEMTGKCNKGKSRRRNLRKTMESFTLAAEDKRRRGRDMIKKMFKQKPSEVATVTAPKEDRVSVRGFLANKFSGSDLLKPPSRESRKEFAPYLLPVTSTQVGRVSGYVAMSHVVASSLGTVTMAAQQVIVSLFYCLCPIADSLSLTAQSFIPSISERDPSREKAAALRKTALNFAKAGAVFGGVMVGAVSTIPLLSGIFTSDPVVVSLVNSVVPLLVAFFAVHGVMCGSEGLLLAQKDLKFLGNMYAGYFFAVPYFMLRVKRAALTGSRAVGITSVWKVFLGYQMFRSAAWLARVVILQRRSEVEGEKAEELLSSVVRVPVSLKP